MSPLLVPDQPIYKAEGQGQEAEARPSTWLTEDETESSPRSGTASDSVLDLVLGLMASDWSYTSSSALYWSYWSYWSYCVRTGHVWYWSGTGLVLVCPGTPARVHRVLPRGVPSVLNEMPRGSTERPSRHGGPRPRPQALAFGLIDMSAVR